MTDFSRNKQKIGRKGARRVKWSGHSPAQFISCWLALDQSSMLKFVNATRPFDQSKPTGKSYRWAHGIRMITEVCKSMGNHHDSPLLRPAKLEITLLAMRWFWRGFQQPWCSITVKLIQNGLWLDQENYIIQLRFFNSPLLFSILVKNEMHPFENMLSTNYISVCYRIVLPSINKEAIHRQAFLDLLPLLIGFWCTWIWIHLNFTCHMQHKRAK